MEFLKEILSKKREEVLNRRNRVTIEMLKAKENFARPTYSLVERLTKSKHPGIITEFKRRSPSKGFINEKAEIRKIVPGYAKASAIGISVLTDEEFFGGSLEDLEMARTMVDIPLLRKDFVIHPYQLFEAKAYGADVVLLISECLEKHELQDLHDMAQEMHLEVLVELHHVKELEKMPRGQRLLGVNNRNLESFEVNLETSTEVLEYLPKGIKLISESGISQPETIHNLWKKGYSGFLMGEHFMSSENPAQMANEFIKIVQG